MTETKLDLSVLSQRQVSALTSTMATLGGLETEQLNPHIDLSKFYDVVEHELYKVLAKELTDTDRKEFGNIGAPATIGTAIDWFYETELLVGTLEDVELQEHLFIRLDELTWHAYINMLPNYAKNDNEATYYTEDVINLLGLLA